MLVTHGDGNRVSKGRFPLPEFTARVVETDLKAFSSVCDSVCVCLFVCLCICPHDKTKTAESTITKLGTGITIPRPKMNIRSKGQGHGHMVTKCKKGDLVAGVSYALY